MSLNNGTWLSIFSIMLGELKSWRTGLQPRQYDLQLDLLVLLYYLVLMIVRREKNQWSDPILCSESVI